MDVSEMRRRLGEAPVARLATVDPKGRPHLVPVCFAVDGDSLYSAVDDKPKASPRLRRLQNIMQHPDVTLLVDHYEDDWSALWWVRLRGKARVVEGGAEYERAAALLAKKYHQYRTSPPRGAVIAVSIDDWRAWSASETMGR